MVNQKRLLNEFLQLVQIDSLSGQERQIADYLKQKLTTMGLSVYEDQAGQKVGATAGNIIAFLNGSKSEAPVIMLSAHMDTVEPGTGIKPVIKDGVIYSEGETVLGSDDKAGIATILEAVQQIQEHNIPHGGIEIVFTIWEEGGLFGAKNLDFSRIKAKMGYVLDADGSPGTIITKAPSHDKIQAVVRGRAAHAGIKPEEGINAIQVAAHAITNMQLGRIDEETTCNIGIISGGKATNIIPETVTLVGETRSLDNLKRKAQTTAICNALNAAAEKFGAQVEIKTELEYSNVDLSEDDQAVVIAITAAKNLGLMPRIEKTGGGSDANIFNQIGIQAVNLGIGMHKVHTKEEFITIEDLINNARYLVEIIKTANK
ncbi:M20/M25/M40 family metallo-hydrolase [Desulfolucanica intricata]|uniref:M20/M25/M40 family metallo-hydrolase n=1 Tax=Desulfolucanica intricata TaxID=1285191 RepID=UPI00082F6CBE|nr:M20/M25/M40 family metallo-hydrolase [Desulfolucanica intricata]